jgi:signal transduction histidine kinase
LIRNGVKDVEGLIKLRNQIIDLDIHDDLNNYVDREKIQSVFSNLLTNAIKFTPKKGKIIIKSKIKRKNMVISITDDGIGLQKEDIEKLFKPFGKIERYGRGWDLISEGIGLGLYISKEIINLHNGEIWAKSQGLHKGSTFYFSLPIRENDNDY